MRFFVQLECTQLDWHIVPDRIIDMETDKLRWVWRKRNGFDILTRGVAKEKVLVRIKREAHAAYRRSLETRML